MTREQLENFLVAVVALRESATDAQALAAAGIYPTWKAGMQCRQGQRICHRGQLYRVLTEHTAQETWEPSTATATLFEPVDLEHGGTAADPIPAATGMRYYEGKYYSENNVIYLCTRDDTGEGTVLYYMPSELVGIYFEVYEG